MVDINLPTRDDIRQVISNARSSAYGALFETKYILAAIIVAGGFEVLTGRISTWYDSIPLEYQLFLLVLVGTALPNAFIALKLVEWVYEPEYNEIAVLDPSYGGDFDILRAGKEAFSEINIQGADELHAKTTPYGDTVYVARDFDREQMLATATWKKLFDGTLVEAYARAIKSNNRLIVHELDKAREIQSSAPAYKQEVRSEVHKEVVRQVEAEMTDGEVDSQQVLANVVDEFDFESLAEKVENERPDMPELSELPEMDDQINADEAGDDDE